MMNVTRCWLMLWALFCLFGANVVFADTLQDAVNHVLQTNPEIRASAYNRLARDQEVKQAEAGYYPSVDVSAGLGVNKLVSPFKRTLHPRSTVVSLRQNVYHFGTTTNEVRRNRAHVKSQAYLVQANSEVISLQTARTYLNVLRAMELHELARENLVNHQRIYDQMKLRAEAGVERRADLDQVIGRLALAESNMVVTGANLEDARTNYLAVTGLTAGDLVKPEPVDSEFPLDMDEAVALAVENYPLVKSAKADLEARRFQSESAKSSTYPSLDLVGDHRWLNDSGAGLVAEGHSREYTAAMTLNFNIFRGGFDRARIAETKQLIKEADEIYRNTERQTVQSIRLSWEAYKSAKEQVTHLQDYAESMGLTVGAFLKQWMVGRRTMFDVLDTQAEYINAKGGLVNARYDRMDSEYRVLAGMGNLVHTLGLQWPEESDAELKPEPEWFRRTVPVGFQQN